MLTSDRSFAIKHLWQLRGALLSPAPDHDLKHDHSTESGSHHAATRVATTRTQSGRRSPARRARFTEKNGRRSRSSGKNRSADGSTQNGRPQPPRLPSGPGRVQPNHCRPTLKDPLHQRHGRSQRCGSLRTVLVDSARLPRFWDAVAGRSTTAPTGPPTGGHVYPPTIDRRTSVSTSSHSTRLVQDGNTHHVSLRVVRGRWPSKRPAAPMAALVPVVAMSRLLEPLSVLHRVQGPAEIQRPLYGPLRQRLRSHGRLMNSAIAFEATCLQPPGISSLQTVSRNLRTAYISHFRMLDSRGAAVWSGVSLVQSVVERS